ncbi:hypothetical protein HYV64_04520 [Candidatus Shapirobacteria bacterium]|nr:hypothetical protein [Candidatus Shapirobacteria bacterium]
MVLKSNHINISVPAKIHLLGEHAVVYGKPALLHSVELRVKVSISPSSKPCRLKISKIIEPIIKKEYNIKEIPKFKLVIDSKIPVGSGLGSSAAVSAACIAAILSILKISWDRNSVNKLAFEAEKVFHGNPSGGDNAAVVFGGLIWFQKINRDEKIIKHLPFSIPEKLAQNFVLINTGKPVESTAEMVKLARITDFFLQDQEKLTNELAEVIKNGDEKNFIRIIKQGEKNLESIGVVSEIVQLIIREIENAGGAAKISGGGGRTKGVGMLLTYHKDPEIIKKIAKKRKFPFFQTELGVEGLRRE